MRTAYKSDLQLSHLDPDDIGRFVAMILTSPPREFNKKAIPLASTHLTMSDVAEGLTKAFRGRKEIKAAFMSTDEAEKIRDVNPVVDSQLVLNKQSKPVDLDEVRSYGVELGSLERFFKRNLANLEAKVGM